MPFLSSFLVSISIHPLQNKNIPQHNKETNCLQSRLAQNIQGEVQCGWFVHSILDHVVRVQTLAKDIVNIVLLSKTHRPRSAPHHPGVYMGTSKFDTGVTLRCTH